MNFEKRFALWESSPPPELRGDPMWRLPAYRIASFLAVVCREDAVALRRGRCTDWQIEQLKQSVDSIGANISEGYGRLHGRDRARCYTLALGSAREARDWYRKSAAPLGEDTAQGRTHLLTRAVKILTAAIPRERAGESEQRILRAAAERNSTRSRNNREPPP
jgi:four helix bundle protein